MRSVVRLTFRVAAQQEMTQLLLLYPALMSCRIVRLVRSGITLSGCQRNMIAWFGNLDLYPECVFHGITL
jgi:hypothetical protein